jgi:hypothetical protein
MTEIALHTRSFHPQENFGAGGLFYERNNRGFATSLGATSSIKHEVVINLEAAKPIARPAISGPGALDDSLGLSTYRFCSYSI